jgi:hypothetical protein
MSWKDLFKAISPGKSDKLPGYLTQYPGVTEDSPKQQLVMGIDFGTAFTKVVIGSSVDSYAVPFPPHANNDNIFLLPGVMSIEQSGICQLGSVEKPARRIADLKMRLLQGDYSLSCLAENAAFLSLVIKHCRGWLLNEHRKVYKGKYLDWFVNVGLPTGSYHDKRLTSIYKKLVLVAWITGVKPDPVNIADITQMLEQLLQGDTVVTSNDDEIRARQLHPDAIDLFPEFVAQITGYVRSSMRQPDLHALVDVGAGTVDATVFNVHEEDDEHKFPIFAKSVKPLGVQYLVKRRLEKSNYKGSWAPEAHENPPLKGPFARKLEISVDQLDKIDAPFRKNLYDQLIQVMRHTKEKRYRKSTRWKTGVPLFLCGGGSKMDFYIDLIDSIESGGPYKIRKVSLPKPDRLTAKKLPRDAYDRLSVAYGLSFNALDIGEIIETSEIDDEYDEYDEGSTGPKICSRCNGAGDSMGKCPKCGGSGWM